MNVELTRPDQLDATHFDIWRRIQREVDALASPFFSPEFTLACSSARRDAFVGVILEGATIVGFFPFQRGPLGVGLPVGGARSNYHGVIVDPSVEWDPRTLIKACRLRQWRFDHLVAAQARFRPYWTAADHSLVVRLPEGFAGYADERKRIGSRLISRVREKERRLGREVGPVRFLLHIDDPSVLRQLMAWKSQQYVRTGEIDRFAIPWNVRLLETLHRTQHGRGFAGVLCALYAGEELAAAAFGLRAGAVLHSWFPAYAPDLARHSPGLVLLLNLFAHAQDKGIATIDLGKGDADYKQRIANGRVELREGAVSANALYAALGDLRTAARDGARRTPFARPALRALRHLQAFSEQYAGRP